MRATITWILALMAGFAAFMGLATAALLPIQAAKNRATFQVVDQYAHRLADAHEWPRNAKNDAMIDERVGGFLVWPSLPGGCQDAPFEAPSDRFAIAFWENGTEEGVGSTWWHCYAFPSRNTTLQLSVVDYLKTSAGVQLLAYALWAAVTGFLAIRLRSRPHFRELRPWPKALWFGGAMTFSTLFFIACDIGDDQFYLNPDGIKWFAVVYNKTIGVFIEYVLAPPIWRLSEILDIGGRFHGDGQSLFEFAAMFFAWAVIGRTAFGLFRLAYQRGAGLVAARRGTG